MAGLESLTGQQRRGVGNTLTDSTAISGAADRSPTPEHVGFDNDVVHDSGDGYRRLYDSDASRKKRKPITAHPACDCEFQYRDYSWKKFTEYEPSRSGVEVREFYVVNMSGKEFFTYAEGAVGSTRVETKFPFVCGEIVCTRKLASAGKLKNVFAWVQSPVEFAGGDAVHGLDERPLHVQQRQEDNVNRTLTSLPLTVDKYGKVIVFRTHGNSLFVQLMPTVRSEQKLLPGTPLFDKNNRGMRAAVGSMYSQHDYVVNCVPTEFCEIPVHKNKQGSDRLRIVCLDRRGSHTNGGLPEKRAHSSSVMSLVGIGMEAIVGVSFSGTSNHVPPYGVSNVAVSSAGDEHSVSSNEADASSDNEIIYNGVVNEKLQITDSFTVDKKNKPPKSIVTVIIDDDGVNVQYVDEKERLVFKWANADPKISYSIMPRRYFNAKANVIDINTAARSGKKEFSLKRFKSLERLL